MAASMADDFAYPSRDARCDVLEKVVLPSARELGLPLALMVAAALGLGYFFWDAALDAVRAARGVQSSGEGKSIALRGPADPQLPQLRTRLANALANAGRSAEAAREYLAAAAEVDPAQAPRFRRRAAEEFFRSGHVAEGLRIGGTVLAGVGVRIPATPLAALASMLYYRFRLFLRGMGSTERAERDLPPALLERIDVLWSLAMGLGPFDIIRATDFQTRHLLLALQAGEPMRLVRGLAHETALRATMGSRAQRLTQRLQARTLALAERIGQPEALARGQLAASIAATANGRWHSAMEWADKAVETLQQGCAGVTYELHLAQFFSLRNAVLLGHFPETQRRYPGLLQEARHQGDLLMTTSLLVVVGGMLRLTEDDPALAHHSLDLAMAGWQQKGFLLQHLDCLAARTNILLYEGRDAEALAGVQAQWRALKKSLLLDAQAIRVTARELQARVFLATGQDTRARPWIRAMAREDCDYGQALALKNAAILEARAGRQGAPELLLKAEMALRACELNLHAESVCRIRGEPARRQAGPGPGVPGRPVDGGPGHPEPGAHGPDAGPGPRLELEIQRHRPAGLGREAVLPARAGELLRQRHGDVPGPDAQVP